MADREVAVRLEVAEAGVRLVPEAGVALQAAVGTRRLGLATGGFRQAPPTEIEIEQAIAEVEDALGPKLQLLPKPAIWQTDDALARNLATKAFAATPPARVGIDDVERAFNAMARAAALGSWAGAVALHVQEAAYLLILRECLHHAGADAIQIE